MKNKYFLALFFATLVIYPKVGLGQVPTFGTASSFALFTANGALTNSGASVITGDIGTNAGAFSGFSTATVIGQTRLPGSAEATQAATDVVNAYNSLNSTVCGTTILPELGGQTLTAGVYCQPTALATSLNGTLTLSGPGIFIIKLNSALTTATNSTITLIDGASADNVFFQINGAATLGTGSTFKGTILATGAIFLSTQASLEGRGLSTAGAISLNNNVVTYSDLSLSAVPGACIPAMNQYSISGIISLTNAAAGTAILTDGASTTTISISAGATSVPYSLTGLTSNAGSHTVIVSYASGSASATYTAPASCTTAPASLGGVVFSDANGDGVQNGGDTPISGAVVTLLNGASSPVASTTTNPSGIYSFTGLTAGVPYSVSFTTPAGYSATTPTTSGPVTLTSGQNNTGVTIGFAPLVTPPVTAPLLSVQTFISLSKAKVGDVLTYNIVLTNSGSASATTTVRDSISRGTTYVAGSAIVPAGTTFTAGQPASLWTIPVIAAGQSLTLTFQASVDTTGILYNIASVPGDTAKVCTSIPVKMCLGDAYTLTAPAGRASYSWYRDGLLLAAQTTNVLVVDQPGSYSLRLDNANGLCADYSCCPFILELDTLPSFQLRAISSTCQNSIAQANGQLALSNFNPTHTYQYSEGATFNPAASLSGADKVIPANGILTTTLTNPTTSKLYTVRVSNSSGCYTDMTVILIPTVCGCPVDICVPYVINLTKRPKRIGDPI